MAEEAPIYPQNPYDLITKTLTGEISGYTNEIGHAFDTLVTIHRARKQGEMHPRERYWHESWLLAADDESKQRAHKVFHKLGLTGLGEFYDHAVGAVPPLLDARRKG